MLRVFVVLLRLKETKPLLIVRTLVPELSELHQAKALEFVHIVRANAASEILNYIRILEYFIRIRILEFC